MICLILYLLACRRWSLPPPYPLSVAHTMAPAPFTLHSSPTPAPFPDHFNGVKALVDSGTLLIPDLYVRPSDQRPNAQDVCHISELPTIDLTNLQGDGRHQLVEAIGKACEEWGFFQVVNHGVSHSLMDEMYQVATEFFTQPTEDKMVYFSTDPKSHMRYGTSFNVREDKVLNWRDFLRFSCSPLDEMMPLWPEKPAKFREITAEFCTQVRRLIHRVMEAISESLGLKSDYIGEAFGSYSQIIAINYYPSCPAPDLTLGFVPHSDPGGITVLMQDEVGGLQVRHKDHWVAVKPVPHAFVVNIADQLQILTNGKYKSVEHRVITNSNKARMSIVNANGPSFDRVIAPAPELLDDAHPAIYTESLYEDFMLKLQSQSISRKSVLDTLKIFQD